MNVAKRILFIGGESSGKTTMCKTLSELHELPWVPEYGRTLFEEKNGQLAYDDMLAIARKQVDAEKVALLATRERYILCDTSPLVTKFYSQKWYGKVDPGLEKLANREYDFIFFCARDFPYVNDGTRSGEAFAKEQEEFYFQNLRQSYIILHGSIGERVRQVRDAML